MADVVNLRQHRKRKARDEKSKKADANRVEFGRTRAERSETRALKDMATKKIEGHLRDKMDAPAKNMDASPDMHLNAAISGGTPEIEHPRRTKVDHVGRKGSKAPNAAGGEPLPSDCDKHPAKTQQATSTLKTPQGDDDGGSMVPADDKALAGQADATLPKNGDEAEVSRVVQIAAWRGKKSTPKNS
ncbi:DUF4169 family protein [Thalassospira sp.]|uniref:DUF4169 family protein n=1 Tax=Thalassospira sp. TaxID=1912094 RepID=UPI003AA9A399